MARTKRWEEGDLIDGVGSFTLTSWKYFHDFIYGEMLDYGAYVYRGQRNDNWKLESTLDRLLYKHGKLANRTNREKHLKTFKYAVRGRRGPNPAILSTENDWWAIGQHNGLSTPLLDWTTSPFVAAFFAYEKSREKDTISRVVFAIQESTIEKKSKQIIATANKNEEEIPQVTEFFRPFSDENSRLVNQGGLFSRAPDGIDLEKWIRQNFKGENTYVLMKIYLPSRDRSKALRSLNRMNINHLSLFPDLYGGSQYCNYDLSIKGY